MIFWARSSSRVSILSSLSPTLNVSLLLCSRESRCFCSLSDASIDWKMWYDATLLMHFGQILSSMTFLKDIFFKHKENNNKHCYKLLMIRCLKRTLPAQ